MAVTADGREIVRLYVDSGPSWRVSGTNSRWNYEIPGTQLTCKPGSYFSVDSVVVAHGWFPINNTNNRLYIRIRTSTNSNPVEFTDHIVQLDQGAPTFSLLAQELTTKLSALGAPTITVTWNPTTYAFRFQMSGTAAYGFMFFNDSRLKQYHFNGVLHSNPRGANQVLGILDTDAPGVGSDYLGYTVLADMGTAVLLRLHSLRIVCPELGGSTLSENGSYGTIAKVSLSEGFGELEVQRTAGSEALWMTCGGRTLKTLNFECVDEYGNELQLPDRCPLSFSIAFEPREPGS